MESVKRFAVFHRNRLFRDLLSSCLQSWCDCEVTSVDHLEVETISSHRFEAIDIVLLDLNLPDAMAVKISKVVRMLTDQDTKVILLVPDQHDRLLECIAAGADGVVLERSSIGDLHSAIQRVCMGETFCSPEIVAAMFHQLKQLPDSTLMGRSESKEIVRLTAREQQVLKLLNDRKSNKEIASELNVSLFTVKNHVHNILEKLKVDSRMEAVDVVRARPELFV